jgi:hypothetical protein
MEKRITEEKSQSEELQAQTKRRMDEETGNLSKQLRFLMSYRAIVIAAQVINIHLGTQPRPPKQSDPHDGAAVTAYRDNILEYHNMLDTVISKLGPCDLSQVSSNLDEVLRTRHLLAHPTRCRNPESTSLESFNQSEVDQLIAALKNIEVRTPAETISLMVLENYGDILACEPCPSPRRRKRNKRGDNSVSAVSGPRL